MDILYLLIPVSVVLVFVIAFFFRWSLKAGQFEDLEGPAYRILMDDDRPSMDGLAGPEKKGGNSTGNEPEI
jgi:cbb3-type cytochrome oxidase maturation protein